jgi:ribosomal protein S27AE
MKCPRCGNRTLVRNSRTVESRSPGAAGRRARLAVSWYTQDWVARERICSKCGRTNSTVELLFDDLAKGWEPRSDHVIPPADLVNVLRTINPDKLTLRETLNLLRQLKRSAKSYNS